MLLDWCYECIYEIHNNTNTVSKMIIIDEINFFISFNNFILVLQNNSSHSDEIISLLVLIILSLVLQTILLFSLK